MALLNCQGEILAKVEPPKKEGTEEQDAFVSVIYCSGTDRLCACTKGKLWACLVLHQSYEINVQGIRDRLALQGGTGDFP